MSAQGLARVRMAGEARPTSRLLGGLQVKGVCPQGRWLGAHPLVYLIRSAVPQGQGVPVAVADCRQRGRQCRCRWVGDDAGCGGRGVMRPVWCGKEGCSTTSQGTYSSGFTVSIKGKRRFTSPAMAAKEKHTHIHTHTQTQTQTQTHTHTHTHTQALYDVQQQRQAERRGQWHVGDNTCPILSCARTHITPFVRARSAARLPKYMHMQWHQPHRS